MFVYIIKNASLFALVCAGWRIIYIILSILTFITNYVIIFAYPAF
jgi:hypothetical protein